MDRKEGLEKRLPSLEDSDSDSDSETSVFESPVPRLGGKGRHALAAIVAAVCLAATAATRALIFHQELAPFSPLSDHLPLLVAFSRNDPDFDYFHRLQFTPVHDARTVQLEGQIPIVTSEEIATFINRWGERRNEGMAVSPDGRRLAGTGQFHNEIALYKYHVKPDATAVVIEEATAIAPEGFDGPHGLAFLDDFTLIVSNREGTLVLVDLDRDTGMEYVGSRPVVSQQALETFPANKPGNHDVAVRKLTRSLHEVIVCNMYKGYVNRYILDGANNWNIVDGEILLANGLHVPDSVAISASGEHMAVSNHFWHTISIYQVSQDLGPDTEPIGELHGIYSPHGIEFAENGRKLLATDAGEPFIYAWTAPNGDWTGVRQYTERYRVKDDVAFYSAHYNDVEGGAKGLTVISDHIAVVTSNAQPLSFFNLNLLTKTKHDNCLNLDFFDPVEVFLKRLARNVEGVRKEERAAESLFDSPHFKLLQRQLEERKEIATFINRWGERRNEGVTVSPEGLVGATDGAVGSKLGGTLSGS